VDHVQDSLVVGVTVNRCHQALDDTEFLVEYLGLKTPEEVFTIIRDYYPKELIPAKTQFLIEEILDQC